MSKINFTRRTFLEKEEIARFQQFLADSPSENAIIGNTSRWGILRTDFQGDTDFLVEPSANAGRIKIEKPENRALTSEGLRILQEAIDNIQVTNDNQWYWVRISHQYVNWEEGTVSVNQNGEMVGSGTKFLETLRGQGTQVPVKIRFAKLDGSTPINSGFYEIVDVTNDLNAVLTTAIEFQNESDLKIVVIGTTPIGETVTAEQEQGIYSYDSCKIELVLEETENEPPVTGFVQDKTFYIARVRNNAGFVDVQDKREDWWEFNVVGLTDKLSIFENLADLQNPDTALANLGGTTVGRNLFKASGFGSAPYYLRIDQGGNVERLTRDNVSADLLPVLNNTYTRRTNNLSDLLDVVGARNNLNVYSKTETFQRSQNLGDVLDAEEARTNLDVYSKGEVDDVITINLLPGTGFSVPSIGGQLSLSVNKKIATLNFAVDQTGGSGSIVTIIPEIYRASTTIRGVAWETPGSKAAPCFLAISGNVRIDQVLTGSYIRGSLTWIIK